jgi:parvulin-like peptidyl-prolyl isomerase
LEALQAAADQVRVSNNLNSAAEKTTFFQIAYQYIQETELRRMGGYLGDVRRAKLRSEVAAAVFAASPPQVLKPIVSNQGVYLICVEEIRQPLLTEQLRAEILVDLFDGFFDSHSR